MRLLLLSAVFLFACASAKDFPAIPSSDAIYNNKTCEEILFAKDRLERLFAEEKEFLPKKKESSLFDANVEKNYRRKIKRYRKIKGQYESALRVASKKCN